VVRAEVLSMGQFQSLVQFPRQTGRLTVGRNITLTLTLTSTSTGVNPCGGGSNTSTVALRVGGDEKEVSILRQYNMVASPTGLGPENKYAGEGQQQL
jgi:hypothetical protein